MEKLVFHRLYASVVGRVCVATTHGVFPTFSTSIAGCGYPAEDMTFFTRFSIPLLGTVYLVAGDSVFLVVRVAIADTGYKWVLIFGLLLDTAYPATWYIVFHLFCRGGGYLINLCSI